MKENEPSSGLMALFENARPVSEIDREGFARDVRKLMDKPSFKAGVIKGKAPEAPIEELGISQLGMKTLTKESPASRCTPRASTGKRLHG